MMRSGKICVLSLCSLFLFSLSFFVVYKACADDSSPIEVTASRGLEDEKAGKGVVVKKLKRSAGQKSDFVPTVGLKKMNTVCVLDKKYTEPDGVSLGALQQAWGDLSKSAKFDAFLLYVDGDKVHAEIGRKADDKQYVVIVFRGLLDTLRTEDEIAGVLAHEMAHGIKNHGETDIERTKGTGMLVDFTASKVNVGGALPAGIGGTIGVGSLTDKGKESVVRLAESGYSRESEVEADDMGIEYSAKAGYSAWGLYDAVNRLKRAGLVTNPAGFNSHPPTERRLKRLQDKATYWENNLQAK